MFMFKLLLFILSLGLIYCCQDGQQIQKKYFSKQYTIEQGQTLSQNLNETSLSQADKTQIINNLGKIFNFRQCRPGDYYEIEYDTSSTWINFSYHPAGLEYYCLEKSSSGRINNSKKTVSARKITSKAAGTISTSLWDAMSSKKIRPELIVNFAEIFAWQIDFLTESRKGDTYKLIWDEYAADNGMVFNGQIRAAQYTTRGQTHTAFLFTNGAGQSDYFTPQGKSLRSAFLRAPLQFRRISSYFSRKRFHPILKYFRPHLGIDYSAPLGTPVSAIGDGTIILAKYNGGFGNLVQIRHPNSYVSYYGHLLRFAKGVRTRTHARQGQIIGYVGSTGLSTGPHLDFRITREGRFVNFLNIRMPAAASINAKELELFRAIKKTLFTKLAEIH